MIETLVVFANSVKHRQHCVAGKALGSGNWIRPVSDINGKELDDEQAKFRNPYGRYLVKPLQKIQMEFISHVPLRHQPENHLISDKEWVQNYNIPIEEIPNYLDDPTDLWGNGNSIDSFLIISGTQNINQSLYLIEVQNLNLFLDETKRRASFEFKGLSYNLPVTDPNFYRLVNGEMSHNNFLCISLAEEYHGRHYKIVATVL